MNAFGQLFFEKDNQMTLIIIIINKGVNKPKSEQAYLVVKWCLIINFILNLDIYYSSSF